MKTKTTALYTTLLLASSLALNAAEPANQKKASPEFERMKSLVGTWKGNADMGHGPQDMTLEYRLTAAGSVLEERIFAGTDHEMVTMYYDRDGKLALTHYCVMGNRPGLTLKSADSKSLTFDFDPACGINPDKESHMHAMTLVFDGPDTIKATWTPMMNGKEGEGHTVTLKRVKS